MPCPQYYEEMMKKSGYPVVRRPTLSPSPSLLSASSSRKSLTSLSSSGALMPPALPSLSTCKSLACPVGTSGDRLYGLRRPSTTTTTSRRGSGETGAGSTSLTLSRRRSSAVVTGAASAINEDNTLKQKSGGNAAFPHAYSDTAISSSLPRRCSSNPSRADDPSSRNAAGGGSRANARFSLVQRSGAPAIRDAIAALDRKTEAAAQHDEQEERSEAGPTQSMEPPTAELSALADCSRDPYYRVIVAASGGIKSIVAAMVAFQSDEDVQAEGCAALASVCTKSPSNRAAAAREGAVEVVFEAVATYGNAVVRGGGLDALEALESVDGAMTPEHAEKLEALREELEDDDGFDVAAVEAAAGKFTPAPRSCNGEMKANLRRRASYAL